MIGFHRTQTGGSVRRYQALRQYRQPLEDAQATSSPGQAKEAVVSSALNILIRYCKLRTTGFFNACSLFIRGKSILEARNDSATEDSRL